jgi:hypothetical protein
MSGKKVANLADHRVELDAKRRQLDEATPRPESSWANTWGAGILGAAAALPSLNILELFITHPERFDPIKSPDSARRYLIVLAVSAPQHMKPILRERESELRRQLGSEDKSIDPTTFRAALDVVTAALNAASE